MDFTKLAHRSGLVVHVDPEVHDRRLGIFMSQKVPNRLQRYAHQPTCPAEGAAQCVVGELYIRALAHSLQSLIYRAVFTNNETRSPADVDKNLTQ